MTDLFLRHGAKQMGGEMTRPRQKTSPRSTRLDELIRAAVTSGSIKLNLFVQDQDWVAIEGDQASLEFLGHLLLTLAQEEGPDFLNLDSPSPVFKTGSQGLILYRKP
jgi:hypothetical protein